MSSRRKHGATKRPKHTAYNVPDIPDKSRPVPVCPKCGKLDFGTRKLAAEAMLRCARREGRDRSDFSYYKCLSGNGAWHFGHRTEVNIAEGRAPRPVPRNERVLRRLPSGYKEAEGDADYSV